MDSVPVTEQTLDRMKDEILNSVRVAMNESSKKRDEKLEKLFKEMMDENRKSNEELRAAFIGLGSMMKSSSDKTEVIPKVSSVSSAGIADENIVRLLQTFKDSMADAGEVMARSNETEVGKYISALSEDFSSVTNILAEKLRQSFDAGVSKFGVATGELADSIVEKNHESLMDVQKETNDEIQKVAHSIDVLIEENNNFRNSMSNIMSGLVETMKQLVEENKKLDSIVCNRVEEAVNKFEQVFEKQTECMINDISVHEKNNAEEFRNSMKEYRDEFVKASADAVAAVQNDMVSRMEETQSQMASLAEKMNIYLQTSSSHEEKSQKQIEELVVLSRKFSEDTAETLKTNSESITNTYKEAFETICITVDDLSEFVKDDFRNSLSEYTDELKSTVDDCAAKDRKLFSSINETMTETSDIVKNLSKQITANTEAYHQTLKRVEESQKKTFDLSKKDLELLEGMIKKI